MTRYDIMIMFDAAEALKQGDIAKAKRLCKKIGLKLVPIKKKTRNTPPMSFNTKIKNCVRNHLFDMWGKRHKKPARHYVCLPARECLCVKHALKSDVIDQNTFISFAEKNSSHNQTIYRTLRRLGYKANQIQSQIQLESLKIDRPVDLMFLDVCCEYTNGIANWVATQVTPNLTKASLVGITYAAHARSRTNRLADGLDKYRKQGNPIINRTNIITLNELYQETVCNVERGTLHRLYKTLGKEPQKHLRYRDKNKKYNMAVSIFS